MRLTLSEYSATFATRERAREFVTILENAEAAEIDFSGVKASPSFVAELLTALSKSGMDVTVFASDEFMAALIDQLVRQLGLSNTKLAQITA